LKCSEFDNIRKNNEIWSQMGFKTLVEKKTKSIKRKGQDQIARVERVSRKRKILENIDIIYSNDDDRKENYIDFSNTKIYAPFTLISSQITVWSMGALVENTHFSSHGCKFRHPYPVGYVCTKYHFNREWLMYITENDGLNFNVVMDNGRIFSGDSPTHPWTDICIHLSNRVLFY
jgi:hypothetical protein